MNLTGIKTKIAEITKKGLFKDASWLLIARLINVVVQAAYFIIVARALGTDNYGSFLAVASVASLIFPFIALGTDNVLVKEVAVNRGVFSTYWGNTLLILILNSIAITSVLILLASFIFPDNISLPTVGFLLASDLFGLGILEASSKALRAVDLSYKTAQLIVINTIGKLIAALCLIVFFKQTDLTQSLGVQTWAWLYCLSSACIAILGILTVNKMAGKPKLKLARIKADIDQGIHFSIGMSANNINNDVDKWMLAKFVSTADTGIYGSAYRFINIGLVPVLAIFNATYPRFFQEGSLGLRNCFKFAKKLLLPLAGYGLISIIGYQVCAPLIPKILGAEYQEAISTLRWLAPIPAMTALQLIAADTLTGSGHQKIRSIVQVITAVLNIVLNLWLIPTIGLFGAIYATLVSDGLRLIILWVIVFVLYRRNSKVKTE